MKKRIIRLEEIHYDKFLKDIVALNQPQGCKKERSTELMTLTETATFFRISQRSLFNWCQNGIIKKIQLGNRVYFRKKDIEELIEKNRGY